MMTDDPVRTVSVGQNSMQYVRFGSGEKTLVILPGLSVKRVMESARSLVHTYKIFTQDYTVYLFDRVMYPPQGYSIADMARDTAAAIKTLGITRADVFGVSQGGMIAQVLAAENPLLVNKLVLGSTSARNNETGNRVISGWARLAEENKIEELYGNCFESLYTEAFLSRCRGVARFLAKETTEKEIEDFIILSKACFTFDNLPHLQRIVCPVFVIGSEVDKVLGGAASHEIAEKLGCEIFMYSDYGHAAYDEAPDYKLKIKEFLSR